jgi:hypothetical protein
MALLERVTSSSAAQLARDACTLLIWFPLAYSFRSTVSSDKISGSSVSRLLLRERVSREFFRPATQDGISLILFCLSHRCFSARKRMQPSGNSVRALLSSDYRSTQHRRAPNGRKQQHNTRHKQTENDVGDLALFACLLESQDTRGNKCSEVRTGCGS